ncbi:monovalent cation/H(+) antiporter subunit G [Bradyrhizobium sp. ISRA443]|uniref:monovalent cation/H(+) antiporter subunit G n=1 Tax=unclassified Bradyrhizobium TaxID=2631580 RepID=UPI002479E5B4|nr:MULTISPECIES: monovalent cation/H(+) antiporter subunit G [unclassified Bradyrhizobium]WGR93117.1 monovalent cation/H(+) antiporter subunit G [Bradyrhizobium sp. ISRA435]WGR97626.1 monovalent cation/H(+) antiporter subunit G [Bradyrhizobium sp. ISRA436]WGS04516.1 monovalent cation/H(+) antiporter subunit G [Bradyrhizobium sp. ISRA437]WGS11397.1 monovalent cation/H(+) antiporter subunit G [Bradyrhizobium sp. ISRA443]
MMVLWRDVFLALALVVSWVGVVGFACLKSPFDRLHCVTFINVAGGVALLVASFLADGASDRVLKIVVMIFTTLLAGAAIAPGAGRALRLRERSR